MDNHRELPPGITIQDLQKEAKALQQAHWNHDPKIVQRLRDELSDYRELPYKDIFRHVLPLGDAQWVIAREYGFRNWKRMLDHLQSLQTGQTTPEPTDPAEQAAEPVDQIPESVSEPEHTAEDENTADAPPSAGHHADTDQE